MRAYLIAEIAGGHPNFSALPYKGFVLGAMSGGFGLYLVAATSDQLLAINSLSTTVGISTLADLDETVTPGVKNAIDAWATVHFPSLPPVPAAWTNRQVIQELGKRVDDHFIIPGTYIQPGGLHPDFEFRVLALAPQDVADFPIAVSGQAWRLINIGADVSLWEAYSDETNLIQIHTVLYETMQPTESWGLLGVVQTYGSAFYPRAVMDTFDHPASELIARRDRIATYLENQGYTNTTVLRAATTEHAQMVGIVVALGYTMTQLWNVMHGD